MKTEVKLTGVESTLALLRGLPPEIASRRGGPVRTALRKAAVVVQKRAKSNLTAAIANSTDADERASTGLLVKNLVVTRGKAPNEGNGERFLVRVRRKVYERQGEQVTTLKTAQLFEYGSSHQPMRPWLRPAFSVTAELAISVAETELTRAVRKAVATLQVKGGGR